jgi:hypothetical protein
MILYTGQGLNLKAFEGRIDPSKSGYNHPRSVHPPYARLYELLKTDQFLWCGLKPMRRNPHQRPEYRYEHKLNVDDADVLAVVTGWLWDFLIHGFKNNYSVPSEVHRRHARPTGSPDHAIHAQWLRENVPEDPWAHLLRQRPFDIDPRDNVLVIWQFSPRTCVVDVTENAEYFQG